MAERKPMLTADGLVDYMKAKGVRFNIISEEQARRQLRENNNYFKLTSFSDNYSRCTSGPNAGKFERLEYAYLQELLQIDLEVRHLLLDMALDVEHSLKMALIIVFLWLASPVSSHLISRLEVVTNEHLAEHCQLPEDKWEDELC